MTTQNAQKKVQLPVGILDKFDNNCKGKKGKFGIKTTKW